MQPLILGGGPAGAAAAITLAHAGTRATVLERTRETADAICGGFLSWRTLDTLARLGISADMLGSSRVNRLRLFAGDRVAQSRLPRAAIGVSRRRLDSLLLTAAERAGAAVERGVAVRGWDAGTVRTADGATLRSDTLFLATGKHDVRGLARPDSARGRDPTLGLRVRLSAGPALNRLVGDAIELHLFDRGYAGLVLQEDGSANLCLAVRRSRLAEAGSPDRLLADITNELPALGDRLARRDTGAPDAIANVPYGWRVADTEPGLFRLGDQAGVIPSLAGEGMGIAIASGIRAAVALGKSGPSGASDYQRALYVALARPIGLAARVRDIAERPWLARPLLPVAQAFPGLMQVIARATRIAHVAP